MDACPACTASLRRRGKLHCTSPTCPWIICLTCGATINVDTEAYWNAKQMIWGNPDGYLKAAE
jgi:hypothetical protein